MLCSSPWWVRPDRRYASTIISRNPCQESAMKLDSKRGREIALVVLVALAAGLANLPEELLDQVGIDRGFLLGSLALMVFIALFLYLKFQFFFLVVLLAIAANMPAEVAENLGISTLPLLIAMATMVGFSVINYVVDLLPTGLEKKPREQSADVNMVSGDGDTATELALRIGSQECADILKRARAEQLAREQAVQSRQPKQDRRSFPA